MMFDGIYVPIATPFAQDESIDLGKLQHNLSRLATSEVAGIIVLGSNGEFPYLSLSEKLELVEFARDQWPSDRTFIVGTGCESTRATIEFTAEVTGIGADAVLVLPPHYYTGLMSELVLFDHFVAVADESKSPVLLYNMPPNTGINLTAALVARLSEHDNIVGIKDTAGNIVQLSNIVRQTGESFSVLAGSAGFLLPALSVGADGGVAALGNVLPDECCRLLQLFSDGEISAARELQLRLLEINSAVTSKFGIPGLKAAMELLGWHGGMPRRPLRPLSAENRSELRAVLGNQNLLGD